MTCARVRVCVCVCVRDTHCVSANAFQIGRNVDTGDVAIIQFGRGLTCFPRNLAAMGDPVRCTQLSTQHSFNVQSERRASSLRSATLTDVLTLRLAMPMALLLGKTATMNFAHTHWQCVHCQCHCILSTRLGVTELPPTVLLGNRC